MLRTLLAACWMALLLCVAVRPAVGAATPNTTLQSAVNRAMTGERGTAVVLDVHSGEMLAAWRLEVAARRVVAPGSSIKPFTLMALLQSGKVDEHTALMCKRRVAIAGHKLDCSHPPTAQPLDPAAALAYSCNSYFTTVALRLTPSELREALVKNGFTSATALAQDEALGQVEEAGAPAQLQLQAIGEWGVRVTPLELLRGYRGLALLQSNHDAKLAPLFAGLDNSVAYGMGRLAQPATGIKVAGKTGTAPSDEGSWTHAWFAGYAPADNPEIVLVVFLEHGHGGSDAAEVARQIFEAFATSRDKLVQQSKGAPR